MLRNRQTCKRFILLMTLMTLSALSSTVRGDKSLTCSLKSRNSKLHQRNVTYCVILSQQSDNPGIKIMIPNSLKEIEDYNRTEKFYVSMEKEFEYLPDNLFEALPNLIEIEVNDCALKFVHENDLKKLSKLKTLNFRRNQITAITEGTFDDLVELEKLILSYNHITSLDKGIFNSLHNLEELDLSYNQINSLDENLFGSLNHLQTLHLHSNSLCDLDPNLFAKLTNLTEVYLRDNQLESLHDDQFQSNTKLEFIWLSSNKLIYLSPNIVKDSPELRYVTLSENICIDKDYGLSSFADLVEDLKANCSTPIAPKAEATD